MRWRAAKQLQPALGLIAAAAVLLLLTLLGTGCEESGGPLPENLPPTTYLAIQGSDLDTLDYRQILHWWGTDPDGEVIGYCVHWDGNWTPPPGAEHCAFDTSWVFTTATTDTFVVPVDGSFAERTFQVRAVDDQGVADPVGRSQLFRLSNWPPELFWSSTLTRPEASLPAVSFAWSPRDLDGRETVRQFRYWLDGTDSTQAAITTDTLIALAPEDFGGRHGERTLSVQALDEALAGSNVLRHTWTVETPTGDYLLIDHVGSFVPGNSREDAFFRSMMDSVAAGNYFLYDVELRGGFRSAREVRPLLSLFRGVVWYGGVQHERNDASVLENLLLAEPGIEEYLEQDGRLLLVANNAVGDTAGLTLQFARDWLGIDDFFRIDGENDIVLANGTTVYTDLSGDPDSIRTTSTLLGADFFLPRPTASPLFWVGPGTLTGTVPDQSSEPATVGVLNQQGGSRAAILSFLPSRSTISAEAPHLGVLLFRRVLID